MSNNSEAENTGQAAPASKLAALFEAAPVQAVASAASFPDSLVPAGWSGVVRVRFEDGRPAGAPELEPAPAP